MTIFDPTSLHSAINRALTDAAIPEGHTNAFALVATLDGGVSAVIATKLNTMWAIDAVVSAKKGTKIDAGVEVKATW